MVVSQDFLYLRVGPLSFDRGECRDFDPTILWTICHSPSLVEVQRSNEPNLGAGNTWTFIVWDPGGITCIYLDILV